MSAEPSVPGYSYPEASQSVDDPTLQAYYAQYYAQYAAQADPSAAASYGAPGTTPAAGSAGAYGYADYSGGAAGGYAAYGTAAPVQNYGQGGEYDYGAGSSAGYGYGAPAGGAFPGFPPIPKKELDPVALAERGGKQKKKGTIRAAGGDLWEDPTMADWDSNDFRIFCGDLGNEVSDQDLIRAFTKYPSFQKAKVVRDKRTNKSKGYGFVSFKDPEDFVRAMKEMQGKYVGNRPIKLRKSAWQERNVDPKALKKAIHGSGIVKTQGGNFAIVPKKAG